MSIINKDTKHTKYETDWEENIKWLAHILPETDKTQLPTLLTEAKQLNQDQIKFKQEITKLETEQQDLGDIVGRQRRVNRQLTDLETNYSSPDKTKAKTSFLGQATNKYDWETKIKNYFPTTYSDNLYEGTVNGVKVKITEQEAIKLLTRVIKALEKVDQTKFNSKFTASTHTTGTNHLTTIQKLAKDGLKSNEIIGKDANDQDLPDKGKPANHTTLNQLEYSFKSQYVDDAHLTATPSGTAFTPQSTETITKTKIDDFFTFINNISKDGTINPNFLTELKSDTDILKQVENNTSWKIVPAQKTPLEPTKLADYGIKVSNDNNTKLYLSEKHDKAVKFSINEGLKSWIELVQAFFPSGSSQLTKLAGSFQNDPYTQLLTDISNNTHSTHWELPENLDDLQNIADQIELQKLSAAGQITKLGEKIKDKNEELTTKTAEFTSKDTELTTLIGKIITQKRAELNKSDIKEFTGDNRKTQNELWKLEILLSEIRYLENDGDATLDSSVADENTALTIIADISVKVLKSWYQPHWDSIGWDKNKSEIENKKITNQQKIALIKENKNNDYFGGLTYYHDQLVELEKLIKLTEQQEQIKTDLKAAIDAKSPQENNQEWRDTLKTIETGLETAFTDAKITEWKKKKDDQAVFDNTASIKSLLEKVKDDSGFITFLKGKDDKIDTLSKLIEKKDPVEVIKLITYYVDYEKLSAEAKKTKKQQLVWTLEKKDKEGKYLDDADLTEEEITDTLYQIAIQKKTLASKKKADETNDDNTNNPQSPTPPKGHFAQYWWVYLLSGIVLIGGLVAIFWKQISAWWKGPAEEESLKEVGEEKDKEEEIE